MSFFSCPESAVDAQSLQFNKNSLKSGESKIEFSTKVEYKHEDLLPKPAKRAEETKEVTEEVEQKTYFALVAFEKEVLVQE